MATLKATILQNFATIGIPDFDSDETTESVNKNWSIVGLSENLIDEDRLVGLQHLNTRRLDLVIHNGSKFALLNLQAFKIFDCEVATNTIRQCLTHYLTPDGNLLFGVQPSGDIVVLTDGLQNTKHVRKPAFIKLQEKQPKWYEGITGRIAEYFGVKNKNNQVSPEQATLQSVHINGSIAPTVSAGQSVSNPAAWATFSLVGLKESVRRQFPHLTSLLDGLTLLCAFSPTDCYLFLSSYETALRTKSIANIRGSQVPGRWYRVIMHKSYIIKWLEDKKTTPFFEARLCMKKDDFGEEVPGGAMLYGAMENLRLELVYGIIQRRADKFTLSWEVLQYDIDWAVRESDGLPYNMGARFVAKLSSDCKKIVIVVSNHLGMYIEVQDIPFFSDHPIHMKRQRVSLCTHCDYDGTHFYKQGCWVSDVQWLVEDAYFAVMTLCGSLSIFYSTGEPMILKIRKPGPESDEDKSARFYFPVFHPHQILQDQNRQKPGDNQYVSPSEVYPTLKWIDSEQVLTCSSGMKIELFSIQRVIPITLENEETEIWLGNSRAELVYVDGLLKRDSRRKSLDNREDEKYRGSSTYSSFANSRRSSVTRPALVVMPDVQFVVIPEKDYATNNESDSQINNYGDKDNPITEYRYNREEDEFNGNNEYDPEYDLEEDVGSEKYYSINDVDRPSHIEELPPDGGEVAEETLENVQVVPSPERLRGEEDEPDNTDTEINETVERKDEEFPVDSELTMLSQPESLHQINEEYNEVYSECSSEPDFGEDCTLAVPSTTPVGELCAISQTEVESALRKRSQQYMADDEAEEMEVNSNDRRTPLRRKSGKTPLSYHSRGKTVDDATAADDEESDNRPKSSSAYDTEYSVETYSSPFSCAPTTAEADNNGDDEQDVEEEDKQLPLAPKTVPLVTARSQSSTTPVSLQIPPVPKISGVIVPTERQSNMLIKNIEISDSPPTTQHVELLKYKPPSTTSIPTTASNASVDTCNVDILHFKSKPIGLTMAVTEEMSPSPEETAEYYDATFDEEEDEGEGEEEEEGQEDVDFRMVDGCTNTAASSFSSSSREHHPPYSSRHRNSSV